MQRFGWMILIFSLALASCAGPAEQTSPPAPGGSPGPSAAPSQPAALTVLVHDSFAASEAVIAEFEQAHNVDVTFVQGGDAGSLLNRAVLTRAAPSADVLYGLDNTFLSRALEADLFEPYASPLLSQVPGEFQLDPQQRVLPIDYGDVCINYDRAYFAEKNLPVPQSLDDLARPEYHGLLVTENPATSSPGLAFLLATIAAYGEDGYLDYWTRLVDNGVVVVNDWETAYYTNFSASSGRGPQPLVVSYDSSPVAEVVFAETELTESPTGSITAPGTCYRQIEFAGILRGTKNLALAQQWIDFMLSPRFQEDMPLQMFVYPVNQQAALPEVFRLHAQAVEQPASLPADQIAANRDAWIRAWTDTVLR